MSAYLTRLKQIEGEKYFQHIPDTIPTKPTKGGFDGFDGRGVAHIEKNVSVPDEATIRAWLESINEHDPACIAEVLDRCRTDAEALAYYLGRSKEVS